MSTKAQNRRTLKKRLRTRVGRALRFGFSSVEDLIATVPLDTGSGVARPAPSPGPFTCREMTSGDVAEVCRVFGHSRTLDFQTRLEQGRGFLLCAPDGPAGFAWSTTARRPREGVYPFFYDISPKPGYLYIYDVHVSPAHRCKGGATVLLSTLLRESPAPGLTRAFLTVHARNKAMRRVLSRLGFDVVGAIRHRNVLWVTKTNTSELSTVSDTGSDRP